MFNCFVRFFNVDVNNQCPTADPMALRVCVCNSPVTVVYAICETRAHSCCFNKLFQRCSRLCLTTAMHDGQMCVSLRLDDLTMVNQCMLCKQPSVGPLPQCGCRRVESLRLLNICRFPIAACLPHVLGKRWVTTGEKRLNINANCSSRLIINTSCLTAFDHTNKCRTRRHINAPTLHIRHKRHIRPPTLTLPLPCSRQGLCILSVDTTMHWRWRMLLHRQATCCLS